MTLPRAFPGIIGATGLATLKVLGDVMIVLFVVGIEANVPQPAFDVLERTGPLTSTGAALVGGVNSPRGVLAASRDCPVGYFTALLLLVMALHDRDDHDAPRVAVPEAAASMSDAAAATSHTIAAPPRRRAHQVAPSRKRGRSGSWSPRSLRRLVPSISVRSSAPQRWPRARSRSRSTRSTSCASG